MNFKEHIAEIKRKIQKIDCNSKGGLYPPLTENEVYTFEKKHQITLPADYWLFLTEVCDGGLLDNLTMFKLEETVAVDMKPALPFPYQEAMRVPYEDTQTASELDVLCEFYNAPENVQGHLVLADEGCGIMTILILNGKHYGKVWTDNRTYEWGGFFPYEEFGMTKPICFLEWFDAWLAHLFKDTV